MSNKYLAQNTKQNEDISQHSPKKKGFASMSREKVEEIAKKGGAVRAAQLGRAGYVALGHSGGLARAKQLGKEGYGDMGRKGAKVRAELAALKKQNLAAELAKDPVSSAGS